MDIRLTTEKYKDHIISLRREFHENPELGMQEVRTSSRVIEELEKLGLEVKRAAGMGVIGVLKGGKEGKTVALRADMDALPIKEATNVHYKSKNEGVMHACGHDGHTAMLIGAAKVLSELKDDLNGTVKFIFQPAEEGGVGAPKMMEEKVLDGVDAILGIHLWMDVEAGKISLEAGPRMASADRFKIIIRGKSGHGSMPHQAIDAIVATSAVIMDLQSIVSREVNPLEPVVISIGKINGGAGWNVICNEVTLEGTTRCFNSEVRYKILDMIKRIATTTASSYRCEAEVIIDMITPPTVNNRNISNILRNSAAKLYDEQAIVEMEKVMGGEDFAYYSEAIPGAMVFVGINNKDKGIEYPHHHEKFNIDEDSLTIGTSLYAQFALDYLNK